MLGILALYLPLGGMHMLDSNYTPFEYQDDTVVYYSLHCIGRSNQDAQTLVLLQSQVLSTIVHHSNHYLDAGVNNCPAC